MLLILLFLESFNPFFCQKVCNGKKVLLIEDGKCNESNYTLVFEDDFDGSSLDTSKWTAITGVVRDPEHSIAQQWYSPRNIELGDGTLKLITRRDTLLNQCYDIWHNGSLSTKCEDFYFTAGQIDSKETFLNGKIELSCRIPKAKGVASSFWMFGDPYSNEIDIFEFENEKTIGGKFDDDKLCRVHRMNSRTDYDLNGQMEDCPSKYKGPDFSESFHTFTLIWSKFKLEWYVDGELKRTSALFYNLMGQEMSCRSLKAGEPYILNKAFPKSPMRIILDNIIQVGSNSPSDDSEFPYYYEIDYVRYYRQSE
ncbi:MAG: glycoside hydrolase family 16 protein [Bacteroidia bacterium]|nr:glycoside hydrolase family 16 protein [Bacteroidia bacterium]